MKENDEQTAGQEEEGGRRRERSRSTRNKRRISRRIRTRRKANGNNLSRTVHTAAPKGTKTRRAKDLLPNDVADYKPRARSITQAHGADLNLKRKSA